MAKNKYRQLSPAAKQSIVTIAVLAAALFFVVAALGEAGLVGNWAAGLLTKIFGWGFFALPVILAGLAYVFARQEKIWLSGRLIGAVIFFITLLAAFSIIYPDDNRAGGIIGHWLAAATVKLFDFYALILLAAIMLVTLLVTIDHDTLGARIKNWRTWLAAKFKKSPANNLSTAAVFPPRGELAPHEAVIRPNETEDQTANQESITQISSRPIQPRPFKPPPLELLEPDSGKPAAGDIKTNANIIKRTLANFGILVEMDEVSVGPSITRYALKPAEGVKLSRIAALQNDLSLALAAHPLRIETPIPGKSLVGIEIPNAAKSIVGLASLIGSQEFNQTKSSLAVSLGRDITGQAHFASLARAPHILIAGATGSGKSVVIHTFIVSLLYKNSPEHLRFIMIDPKRVELTLYNQIPHLLTPVVTDPKKVIAALRWAAREMERRYLILEETAVRDVQSYHQTLAKASKDADLMPYIVIIIDELADIMSTYPRELEAAIVRLSQMSRAVGIHLVLSTQRPSVEIITGLIKANISSRMALQVASQIDSRTILDMAGAEKLLGAGDLLYLSSDRPKPIRLQSAFISEAEVKKVVSFINQQYPEGTEEILSLADEVPGASTETEDPDGDDELYEEARDLVIRAGKASASYLQRKLRIGYARAARLLDMLEERKIIGPGAGAKIREVYERHPPPQTSE